MPLPGEAPLLTSPPCRWTQPRVDTHLLEGRGLPSRICMLTAGRLPVMLRYMTPTSSGTFPMSSRNGPGPSQRTIVYSTPPKLPSHAVHRPLIHPLPSHQVSGHWMLTVAQPMPSSHLSPPHVRRPTEVQQLKHTRPNQQLLPPLTANEEYSRSRNMTHAIQACCSNQSLDQSPKSN
jgi:hypothetical protein